MQIVLSIVGRDNNIAGKNAVEMFRSPYKFAKVSGGEGIVFSVCFYFGEEGISGAAFGMGVGVGWPLNVYAGAGLTFIVGTQNELASATELSRRDGEKRDNFRGG